MEELNFTWVSALKIFAGLLLLGVWLLARQQARADASERKARQQARENHTPLPGGRMVSQSTWWICAFALLLLSVVLLWGNRSAI